MSNLKGKIVFFGTQKGTIVEVDRIKKKVSVLMESGREQRNMSLKIMQMNPRWTLTDKSISEAELDAFYMAKAAVTDLAYTVKIEVVDKFGNEIQSFGTVRVNTETSVEKAVEKHLMMNSRYKSVKVIDYKVSDDQLTPPAIQ